MKDVGRGLYCSRTRIEVELNLSHILFPSAAALWRIQTNIDCRYLESLFASSSESSFTRIRVPQSLPLSPSLTSCACDPDDVDDEEEAKFPVHT